MTADDNLGRIGKDATRRELLRIIDEFRSERDAAKQDTMRAVEERDRAIAEVAVVRAKADAAGYLRGRLEAAATYVPALLEAERQREERGS